MKTKVILSAGNMVNNILNFTSEGPTASIPDIQNHFQVKAFLM